MERRPSCRILPEAKVFDPHERSICVLIRIDGTIVVIKIPPSVRSSWPSMPKDIDRGLHASEVNEKI